jgi:hypothetical protein
MTGRARAAAEKLGLEFEHRHVGYGALASSLLEIGQRVPA